MRTQCISTDDTPDVVSTAALLEISEFEVFDVAYRAWYDEAAPEAVLERHFVPYMFEGTAPFWVHQFTRETLRAHGVRAADVLKPGRPPEPGELVGGLWGGLELLMMFSLVLVGVTPALGDGGATIAA